MCVTPLRITFKKMSYNMYFCFLKDISFLEATIFLITFIRILWLSQKKGRIITLEILLLFDTLSSSYVNGRIQNEKVRFEG